VGNTLLIAPGVPLLSVSGGTVRWRPVALESAYRVAISTAPRGSATRVTQYLSIPRIAGEQSYTPTVAPGETTYVGISADEGMTWSEQEATVTIPLPTPEPEPGPATPPVLKVIGGTVRWRPVALESAYKVAISTAARGSATRVTQYLSIPRIAGEQSYTPTVAPGETTYVGISADEGMTWSEQEATVTIPLPTPEPEPGPATPPVLKVIGNIISWTAVPGAVSYELATILHPATTRDTTYKTVTSTSVTPPSVPGQTVSYGLAVNALAGQGPWAQEVSISYPAAPPVEPPVVEPPLSPPPVVGGRIVGTNDGAGWGPAAARTIIAGHITWNRVEVGASSNTLAASLGDGFHVLGIVGNTNDGTPLSQVDPNSWAATVVSELQSNPGIAIAEAGNEMFLKGGVANPIQYARMYLAAVNAMKAAGIHIPLLFDMFGDYPQGSWSSPTSWSRDSTGGGWLRDALANVPGLGAAILANGVGTHPYGAIGENSKDSYGTAAVAAEENLTHSLLGSTPTFYITEFGFDLKRCGEIDGACSQEEQATKMRAAYKIFLNDPHVAGIWAYQSHDDSTGQWGYMNNDNTTRPTFNVLTENAIQQGQ
jgi:hypothetical protein